MPDRPLGGSAAVAWLDGALVPVERAAIPVDDLGFLYGAACFETMLATGGRVFRLGRHLDRLEAGLATMRVRPPSRAALETAVAATLQANGLAEARVRLTVSAGSGPGRPDLDAAGPPRVLVTARQLEPAPGPARLVVASQRLDESHPLRHAKHANYLLPLLARAEARAAGFDDALLLNHAGEVAEAATANLFAFLDGRLVTPHLASGALPGVTREAVLELAGALLPVAEIPLPLSDLDRAEEIFLTSSIAGLRPVAAIESRWTASTSPGPWTERLGAAYAALVWSECQS